MCSSQKVQNLTAKWLSWISSKFPEDNDDVPKSKTLHRWQYSIVNIILNFRLKFMIHNRLYQSKNLVTSIVTYVAKCHGPALSSQVPADQPVLLHISTLNFYQSDKSNLPQRTTSRSAQAPLPAKFCAQTLRLKVPVSLPNKLIGITGSADKGLTAIVAIRNQISDFSSFRCTCNKELIW